MNKVKELRIDNTFWATPARLVHLLDFEPEKISIETENNANNIKIESACPASCKTPATLLIFYPH